MMKQLFARKNYTGRQYFLRFLMQSSLWSGIAAFIIGLTFGTYNLMNYSDTIKADVVYRSSPPNLVASVAYLSVGIGMFIYAAWVADLIKKESAS